MNRVKKGLDNQAIGLLPLLLFMFLDNYFSYLLSFIIGVTFCFVCIFLFQVLSKDKVYQFMLLPSAGTLVYLILAQHLKQKNTKKTESNPNYKR
jgi:positive regulator of sigma E activity